MKKKRPGWRQQFSIRGTRPFESEQAIVTLWDQELAKKHLTNETALKNAAMKKLAVKIYKSKYVPPKFLEAIGLPIEET